MLLACMVLAATLAGNEGDKDAFTLPAEFEPQQTVWMSARPTESRQPVLDTVVEMVRGVVLEAAYWKPGRPESMRRKDAVAANTLKQYFPDREIVQIDPESLNHGGGGMHCATQQQPKAGKSRN